MKGLNMHQRVLSSSLGLTGTLCALALPFALQAQSQVGPGWNCFDTVGGTTYAGVSWQGVPLGTFNFGGALGVQSVGQTDTIIQRTGTTSAVGGTTALSVVALQLQTATPVSLGGGPVGYYFATLDPNDLGLDTGLLTIDSFPASGSVGTFHDYFDVFFDIHFGSLDGPIVAQQNLELDAAGTWWPTLPSPIPPVVHHDPSSTDWHIVTVDPSVPDSIVDGFYPTPEPSSWALFGCGVLCLVIVMRRRHNSHAILRNVNRWRRGQ